MGIKKKRDVSFNTLVKMFLREYGIPTKRDLERLIDRLDNLEDMIKAMSEDEKKKKKVRSESAKNRGENADAVIGVIREYPEGAGIGEIQRRTGFDDKKLRNIIFRLYKTGRIERISRGVYRVS